MLQHRYDNVIKRIFPDARITVNKLTEVYDDPDTEAFFKIEASITATHFFHVILPGKEVSPFMNNIYIHDYRVRMQSNEWGDFSIADASDVKAKVIYEGPILTEAEMEFILTNLDTIGGIR